MPFTADELSNIQNSCLQEYIDKGKVWAQNVQNKPMLKVFNANAGKFSGGKETVSWAVKSGQGGGKLAGYSHDDVVSYYNPTGTKRANAPWREHHIGITMTHTELKYDGIDISNDNSTSPMAGREEHVLANLLDEKNAALGEDYARSLDLLIHQDGSSDSKAMAGLASIVLDNPLAGSTFGVSRVVNPWWRNRAATAAYAAAGGQGAITSSATNGGALIEFLENEWVQLNRYIQGGTKWNIFAGSDFLAAYKREIRANGYYSQTGFTGAQDGGMGDIAFKNIPIQYDPTLDSLGMSKRCYVLDLGTTGLRLMYMDGQRLKRHNPMRPYDRYVMYTGLTMTGVMIAKQLNTSAVYDIA